VSTRAIRPEIQALRALAVALVVVCHTWPGALPGGFIGVDVFFVISGFLITGQLLGEVGRTGSVSLAGFWARRARRILPAALLVLGLVAGATLLWVPQNHWDQFLTEVRASTAYVENWQLAHTATDYFANAASVQSPVQHYWSLSAEEQFYLVWPLLIGLVVALRGSRRALAGAMGVLAAASLAYSVHDTAVDRAAAYFVTPTRAWEFAAGGLLALVTLSRARPWLSYAGLAAIAVAAATYGSGTAFPGIAALLPVLGAVAVIAAQAPTAPLRARPVQWLGDVSYSVYLWHWPLLILAPYALGRTGLTGGQKLAIVAITLLAAWASKVWVEDPLRSGPLLARRPARWTFAGALAGTALVFALTTAGVTNLHERLRVAERTAARTFAAKPKCLGAAARDPRHPCHNAKLARTVVPTPAEALRLQRPCDAVERTPVMVVCAFGEQVARPRGTAVLVGDSHAMHLQQTVQVAANDHRFRALLNARSHCPYSAATVVIAGDAADQAGCNARNRALPGWFRAHPTARVAFIAHFVATTVKVRPQPGQSEFAAEVDGYERAWRALPKTVRHIVVVRDTPVTPVGTLDCITRAVDGHERAGPRCAFARGPALPPDPAAVAARQLRGRVRLVDLNRFICDRRRCYPVVGGVLVYKDLSHLTPQFATTLGPYLDRAANVFG
jgi:peptidoglycan/LPS O-acetylase OafA/YrhL